jgi:hypothetical protein
MVMEPGMQFSPADWAKLAKAQKRKLLEFKKQKRAPASTANVSIHNATTNPAPTTTTPTTTSPATTTTNNCDIHQLLSNNTSRDSSSVPSYVVVDGRTYTLSYCAHACTYSLHQQLQSPSGSLIDGGANGGLSGSDVVVLSVTLLTANVTGIADNSLTQIPICTVAGLIQTQHGPIIGVFHPYAHQGTGKTIHSVSQMRHFGTIVENTPRHFGVKRRLETLDGYIIPLSICSG